MQVKLTIPDMLDAATRAAGGKVGITYCPPDGDPTTDTVEWYNGETKEIDDATAAVMIHQGRAVAV